MLLKKPARSLPAEAGVYQLKRWEIVEFVETMQRDESLAMSLRLKRKGAADEDGRERKEGGRDKEEVPLQNISSSLLSPLFSLPPPPSPMKETEEGEGERKVKMFVLTKGLLVTLGNGDTKQSKARSIKRYWSPRKMGGREFFGTFTQIDYKLWTGTT